MRIKPFKPQMGIKPFKQTIDEDKALQTTDGSRQQPQVAKDAINRTTGRSRHSPNHRLKLPLIKSQA